MDAGATIDAVRDQTETERDRLGSDKMLIAATDATLETEAVLTAAATRESGLADILGRWADESDSDVATQFGAAAEAAAERADRIDADAGDPDGSSTTSKPSVGLRGASGPASSLRRCSPTGSTCR